MVQQQYKTIHQVLKVLHEGGRIDRFSAGNVFLTNIFGELLVFSQACFELLLREELIHPVHLHLPGGECYKISPAGLDQISQQQLETICPLPKTAS